MCNCNPAFVVGLKNLRASSYKDHAATNMHKQAMLVSKKQSSSCVTEYVLIANTLYNLDGEFVQCCLTYQDAQQCLGSIWTIWCSCTSTKAHRRARLILQMLPTISLLVMITGSICLAPSSSCLINYELLCTNVVWWIPKQPDSCLKFMCSSIWTNIVLLQYM